MQMMHSELEVRSRSPYPLHFLVLKPIIPRPTVQLFLGLAYLEKLRQDVRPKANHARPPRALVYAKMPIRLRRVCPQNLHQELVALVNVQRPPER